MVLIIYTVGSNSILVESKMTIQQVRVWSVSCPSWDQFCEIGNILPRFLQQTVVGQIFSVFLRDPDYIK